jgi:beta-glucosidase
LRYTIGEFGHGLSYTTFKYENLTLNKSEIGKHELLLARVTVTNVGKVTGKEAVLWFIFDEVASITRPVKLLKHFEKRKIRPGASHSFFFEIIPQEHLSFLDRNGNFL